MISHIPELVKAGLSSWKIEGRMKSIHYVATVVKTYREALDLYWENPKSFRFRNEWLLELQKVSDRGFTTGFYFGADPGGMTETAHQLLSSQVQFAGLVLEHQKSDLALVEQRNRFAVGDWLEVLEPEGALYTFQVKNMYDESGAKIEAAPHPQQKVYVEVPKVIPPYSLLRRKV